MLREYITNKWVLSAIGFLIVFSVACVLWYRYDMAPDKQQLAKEEEMLRERETETDTETKETTKATSPGETARKREEAKRKNKIVFYLDELPKRKGENMPTGVSETTKQEETTQPDAEVSPYGFGPYPEIPANCPYPIKWNFPGSGAEHELMQRVAIKLWTQGIETMGSTVEDGLVYPNYINTVYIRWGETTDDDGNPIQYIKDLGGYPPACLRIEENNIARLGERGVMTNADIPSDVTVKLYDEAGIDPYSFLNLPK